LYFVLLILRGLRLMETTMRAWMTFLFMAASCQVAGAQADNASRIDMVKPDCSAFVRDSAANWRAIKNTVVLIGLDEKTGGRVRIGEGQPIPRGLRTIDVALIEVLDAKCRPKR
jgi:hypothetical protein